MPGITANENDTFCNPSHSFICVCTYVFLVDVIADICVNAIIGEQFVANSVFGILWVVAV